MTLFMTLVELNMLATSIFDTVVYDVNAAHYVE